MHIKFFTLNGHCDNLGCGVEDEGGFGLLRLRALSSPPGSGWGLLSWLLVGWLTVHRWGDSDPFFLLPGAGIPAGVASGPWLAVGPGREVRWMLGVGFPLGVCVVFGSEVDHGCL